MGFLKRYARRLGVLQYQGTWNAETNNPELVSGVGSAGDYYIVSAAGSTELNGESDWQPQDWAVFNGETWEKIDNSEKVTSVNGMTGDVTISTDISPTYERIVLTQTDVDNGYITLISTITGTPQVMLYPDRAQLLPIDEFTVSGARINFVPETIGRRGESALVAGDVLYVYSYSLSPTHERIILSQTDISNGFIEVGENINGRPFVFVYPMRLSLFPQDDFTVVDNRITWNSETVGVGGAEPLVVGDIVHIYYFESN